MYNCIFEVSINKKNIATSHVTIKGCKPNLCFNTGTLINKQNISNLSFQNKETVKVGTESPGPKGVCRDPVMHTFELTNEWETRLLSKN